MKAKDSDNIHLSSPLTRSHWQYSVFSYCTWAGAPFRLTGINHSLCTLCSVNNLIVVCTFERLRLYNTNNGESAKNWKTTSDPALFSESEFSSSFLGRLSSASSKRLRRVHTHQRFPALSSANLSPSPQHESIACF